MTNPGQIPEPINLTQDQMCSAILSLSKKFAVFHNTLRETFTKKEFKNPLGPVKTVTLLSFAKGCKTFYAGIRLYEEHFFEDVAILARSLINIAINVRYIRSSQHEELALRFLKYEDVEKHEIAKRWQLGLPPEKAKGIETAAEEAKKVFGYEGQGWSGKPIEQMAKSFPPALYQNFYRYLSAFEHSSPISLNSFVSEDSDGRIKISDEPDPKGRNRDVIFALYTFCAYLTGEFIQEFLPEKKSDFEKLNTEFQGIMKPGQ